MPDTSLAWETVAARLRPVLARRLAAPDVDDVLQEALLAILRGLPGLADAERFDGWARRIAENALVEHHRRRVRRPPTTADEAALAAVAAGSEDDEARAVERAVADFVAGQVADLPPAEREAVTLVEFQGLTQAEAAARVGLSVPGMKSRVQRGRARLRERLEACCAVALDARGRVIECEPHAARGEDCCEPGRDQAGRKR
jgi:RNA polymerase sigma-70 factor (ECF subfamily)